ncbi:MAG: Gfo/Idh/MocA family oxidoreductase [Clostridia bacterium]|nr:Gfo/Idh/MocA family oxidoreductase [Clostridia bacterium]
MAKNILNIAAIGCSAMGEIHLQGLKEIEGINLYAICDSARDGRLAKCKEKFGVEKAVTDYKELLNDDNVDAVILVVPDQIHCEMVCAFLRAGKDVLCEKPFALTMEECKEMMRVEKETGRRLMVGQICRFTDNFVKAKEVVDSGKIGENYFVES